MPGKKRRSEQSRKHQESSLSSSCFQSNEFSLTKPPSWKTASKGRRSPRKKPDEDENPLRSPLRRDISNRQQRYRHPRFTEQRRRQDTSSVSENKPLGETDVFATPSCTHSDATATSMSSGALATSTPPRPRERKLSWGELVEMHEQKTAELEKQLAEFKEHIASQTAKYKTTFNKDFETDVDVLIRRQKQVDLGKNGPDYSLYQRAVARHLRDPNHPRTPNKFLKMSRRAWDGQVRVWRRALHHWSSLNSHGSEIDDMDVLSFTSEASDASLLGDFTPATPPTSPFGSAIALNDPCGSDMQLTTKSPLAGTLPHSDLTSDVLTMALSEIGNSPRKLQSKARDPPPPSADLSFRGKLKTKKSDENVDLYDFIFHELQGKEEKDAASPSKVRRIK